MIVAVIFLQYMKGNKDVANVFRVLRMTVVGLIAAAALQLLSVDSFGQPGFTLQFVLSLLIFVGVFILSLKKVSPILLIAASGLVGIVAYAF